MSGAVAEGATASAPTERGWRWFILALVLMVAITLVPLWPPALSLAAAVIRVTVPVEQFALLVIVAIAACTIVGWWAGGRFSLALLWVAIAGWMLYKLPFSVSGYGAFAKGWVLVLGASFGLVCFATAARPFLSRALAAVALATVVTGAGLAVRNQTNLDVVSASGRMISAEYQRRLDESLSGWRSRTESPAWQAFAARLPEAAASAERSVGVINALVALPRAGEQGPAGPLLRLAPALLAVESILALALGWAAYHRLSRARIGPPLGALRDVRFNDQWIWGLVVGFTVLLLPTLAEWRTVGLNLVVFFGLLYAARGLGVMWWWIPDRWALLLPLGLLLLVPLLGPLQVVVGFTAIAFGIGLSDTWRDFRSGAAPRRPASPS